jgi:outer membrane protein TolC
MRDKARGSWDRRGRRLGILLLALGAWWPAGVAWASPAPGPGPRPGPGPEARAALAQAQASSAALGSARGRYYPSLSFEPTLTRTQALTGVPRTGTVAGAPLTTQRTALTPSVTLSYLLLDFGGRSGTVDEARQMAVAANETSDATVQTTVLQAEGAYFGYNAARDLLAAERENVRTATESSVAAADRYHVGLATVADTLQAATALAQAQLALLTAQGDLQTARGDLAAAIGASAEMPFEVAEPAGLTPVRTVAADVDSLIQRAVRERPELEAAHATAAAARDELRIAHAATLPSVSLSGNAGRALADTPGLSGNTYALTLGLQLPLFSGFSRRYDIKAAAARADAADARADATRIQVANQVFTSYANLQVATARVQASAQALASATESEDVARGRYREGVGSFIDLIVAQNALAAARGQAAGARWGWYTALAQLAHDAGTLDRSGDARLPMSADTSATPGKTE